MVNGYLFAPWLVRPIPWLDAELARLEQSAGETQDEAQMADGYAAALSDRMAEAAPPHAQDYLNETEHDGRNQPRFSPLLKRKRKTRIPDPTQGTLF
jgi:hypothetical protein